MAMEKEKLQKIVATCLSAVCVVVLYYYFVIEPVQLARITSMKKQISELQRKLDKAKENDKKFASLVAISRDNEPFLAAQETKVVRGDPVAWLWREMGDFAENEKMSRVAVVPEGLGLSGLPENDSYQTASASLNLYCGYHKLGEFIRDLENSFSTLQVQHLEILGGSGDADGHIVRVQFQLLAFQEEKQETTDKVAQGSHPK